MSSEQWTPVGVWSHQDSLNRPLNKGGRLITELRTTGDKLLLAKDSDGQEILFCLPPNVRLCRRTEQPAPQVHRTIGKTYLVLKEISDYISEHANDIAADMQEGGEWTQAAKSRMAQYSLWLATLEILQSTLDVDRLQRQRPTSPAQA